ncbi:hypothetical protein PO124_00435 [Bacillus licheniformis]|nr:hypothetical protein [Bacillus licheniformis]
MTDPDKSGHFRFQKTFRLVPKGGTALLFMGGLTAWINQTR